MKRLTTEEKKRKLSHLAYKYDGIRKELIAQKSNFPTKDEWFKAVFKIMLHENLVHKMQTGYLII